MIRRYSRGLFQQDRPKADMGHIQVPQRSSLLPSEVCYPFCRKHGRRQAVIRHEFITLLGARTRSARGMRERASTNSISLRILLVAAAAALGYVVPAQAENFLPAAICTLHVRPVHPGARQSEGGDLHLQCRGRPALGHGRVRYRQTQHRRQWRTHRVFPVRAQAICAGQTHVEMRSWYALDLVP